MVGAPLLSFNMLEYLAALGLCVSALDVTPALAATLLAFVVAFVCAVRGYQGVALAVASVAACDTIRALLAPLYQGTPKPYEGRAMALWLAFGILPALVPPMVYLWVGARCRAPWLPLALLALTWGAYPSIRGSALLDVILALYGGTYLIVVVAASARSVRRGEMRPRDLMLVTLGLSGLASLALLRLFLDQGWGGVPITYSVGLIAVGAQALLCERRPPPQGERLSDTVDESERRCRSTT